MWIDTLLSLMGTLIAIGTAVLLPLATLQLLA